MKITWKTPKGKTVTEAVGAAERPFVEAIGLEATVRFFEVFGGRYVYFTDMRMQDRNRIAQEFGAETAKLINSVMVGMKYGGGSYRVPLSNIFIARVMRSQGRTIDDISNKLRATDSTVRRWLLPNAVQAEQARKLQTKRHKQAIAEAKAEMNAAAKPVTRAVVRT